MNRSQDQQKDGSRSLATEVTPKTSMQNQQRRDDPEFYSQSRPKGPFAPLDGSYDESSSGLPLKLQDKQLRADSMFAKFQQNKNDGVDRSLQKRERPARSPSPVEIRELVQLQSQVCQIPVLKSTGKKTESLSNDKNQSDKLRRRDLSESRESMYSQDYLEGKDWPEGRGLPGEQAGNEYAKGTLLNKIINPHTIRAKSPQYDPFNMMRQKELLAQRGLRDEEARNAEKKAQEKEGAPESEVQSKNKINKQPIISFRAVGGNKTENSKHETNPDDKSKGKGEGLPIQGSREPAYPGRPSDNTPSRTDEAAQQKARSSNQGRNDLNPPNFQDAKEKNFNAIAEPKSDYGTFQKDQNTNFSLQTPNNLNNVKSSVMPILAQKNDLAGSLSLTSDQRSTARKEAEQKLREQGKIREKNPAPGPSEDTKQKRSHSEKASFRVKQDGSDLFGRLQKNLIPYLKANSRHLPELEEVKVVAKQYGPIRAFAVSTHRGTVRSYNEDRVSVLLNAHQKPSAKAIEGQKSGGSFSLFSIFDGHGGNSCCNFLKERLHNHLFDEINLSAMTLPLLTRLYQNLDQLYMNTAIDNNLKFSGSCSTTLVVQPNGLGVINVGDSRVLISRRGGREAIDLTIDQKPERDIEFARVADNGGDLYRISSNMKTGELKHYFVKTRNEISSVNELERNSPGLIFGPWRIKPGGLSVSRSFGDIESKVPQYGGTPGTVVADPELFFCPLDDLDFVLLGCEIIRRRNL